MKQSSCKAKDKNNYQYCQHPGFQQKPTEEILIGSAQHSTESKFAETESVCTTQAHVETKHWS